MRKQFQLEVLEDPRPDLFVDRGEDQKGVGKWIPEQKHVYLAKYIGAASEAMKVWPRRVYIDPFCGPGRLQVENESFTRDGGSLVAWRQAAKLGAPYTQVLVGDINPVKLSANRDRLTALGAPVTAFEGPAVETVKEMVKHVQPGSLCLAYIDPYNLAYLSMEIIETLATLKNVDFAVHFSTMDLLRNVDAELDPDRARFDEVAPGWRNMPSMSKASLPVEFMKYWMRMVQDLGFKFSREQPLVHNNTNKEIYRLVFFARHKLPNKLWGDIAKSPNMELGFD